MILTPDLLMKFGLLVDDCGRNFGCMCGLSNLNTYSTFMSTSIESLMVVTVNVGVTSKNVGV